jgi:hypothetical protein
MTFQSMRYNCAKQGCFNVKNRPDFGVFADCFPGKISMTDIDGAVNVKDRFLFVEFKSDKCEGLARGQELFFERLAQDNRNTIVIAAGDCERMQFSRCMTIENGRFKGWEHTSIEMLRDRMKRWADHALAAQVLT